jgi:fused signal recognition particle receptor
VSLDSHLSTALLLCMYRLQMQVLLCAADTFRAAAVEQLVEWSTRAAVDIVVPLDSDERPESVASRACEKALAEQYDVVIVDTSGRLSNNRKLNEELRGMKKAIREKVKLEQKNSILIHILHL